MLHEICHLFRYIVKFRLETMEKKQETIKIRMSSLVLVKERKMLVFNDQVRVIYKHPKTFRLIWTLCKLLKEKKFEELNGVPPNDLEGNFRREGLTVTKEDVSTLWHDEVLFKRHHSNIFNLYDAFNIKYNSAISSPKLLSDIFGAFFNKVTPPENSSYHRNTKFYTVSGNFDQIFLFENTEDAKACGYSETGVSEITRYRTIRGVVGFLDWQYLLKIDEKGGEHSKAHVKMANLSSRPIGSYMLPLWSKEPIRDIKVWLKEDEYLPIDITTKTEGKQRVVEFVMHFPKPVSPGEIIEFNYSFYTPKCYKFGDNYFDWYFDQPQSKYEIDIHAPSNMTVSRPVVYEDQNEEVVQVKTISKRHIQWTKYFPRVGSNYRIDFVLEDAGRV